MKRPRELYRTYEHIVGRSYRTVLKRQFYGAVLDAPDATDSAFIEKINRTGRLECDSFASLVGSGPGGAIDNINDTGGVRADGAMRAAELYSRDANRKNSAWFNDAMLTYFRAKWAHEDVVKAEEERKIARNRARWEKEKREREAEVFAWHNQEKKRRAEIARQRKRDAEEWERQAKEHDRQEAATLQQRQKNQQRWEAELRRQTTEQYEKDEVSRRAAKFRESILNKPDKTLPEIPLRGHVIYWRGLVVIREEDEPDLAKGVKQYMKETSRAGGMVFYLPTKTALDIIWPEETYGAVAS